MVHFFSVTELMDYDAVDDFRRGQHQQTVEIQIPFGAAASPSCFLDSDRNPAIGDADEGRVILYAFRDRLEGSVCERLDFIRRQFTSGVQLFLFRLLFGKIVLDPPSVLRYKELDRFETVDIDKDGFQQMSLFGEEEKEKQKNLDKALDKIRSKYGNNSVMRAGIGVFRGDRRKEE